jgi:hypothetical protein
LAASPSQPTEPPSRLPKSVPVSHQRLPDARDQPPAAVGCDRLAASRVTADPADSLDAVNPAELPRSDRLRDGAHRPGGGDRAGARRTSPARSGQERLAARVPAGLLRPLRHEGEVAPLGRQRAVQHVRVLCVEPRDDAEPGVFADGELEPAVRGPCCFRAGAPPARSDRPRCGGSRTS